MSETTKHSPVPETLPDPETLATEEFLRETFGDTYVMEEEEGVTCVELSGAAMQRLTPHEKESGQELGDPEHETVFSPRSGSRHDVYFYRQGEENEELNLLYLPLGSSRSTVHGRKTMEALAAAVDGPLMNISGSETRHAKVPPGWSPEQIPEGQMDCIKESISRFGLSAPTINIYAQSKGTRVAVETAKSMQGDRDLQCAQLNLFAPPQAKGNSFRFAQQMARQESRSLVSDPSKETLRLLGQFASITLHDRRVGVKGNVYKQLIDWIVNTDIRLEGLDPETKVSIVTGEKDELSQPSVAQLMEGHSSPHHVKPMYVEVAGKGHSTFLLDYEACAGLAAFMHNRPREYQDTPSVA